MAWGLAIARSFRDNMVLGVAEWHRRPVWGSTGWEPVPQVSGPRTARLAGKAEENAERRAAEGNVDCGQ